MNEVAKKKRDKGKAGSVVVDFTGVEGRVLLPEGDIKAKVKNVTKDKGDEYDYLKWSFLTIDDDKTLNNKLLYYITSLAPQALWNLRNLLEALGAEVPSSEHEVVYKDYEDMEIMLTLEDDEYEKKKRSVIVDFYSIGRDDDKADDDEAEVDPEDSSSDDLDEDEVGEMSKKELKEAVEELELDVDLKEFKGIKKQRAAVWTAYEAQAEGKDDSEDGDDDELTEDGVNEMGKKELKNAVEEYELDVELKGSTKKQRKAVWVAYEASINEDEAVENEDAPTKDEIGELDEDELAELIEEHELDVDLKKLRSIRKKRNAVIDACEEADMFEDD